MDSLPPGRAHRHGARRSIPARLGDRRRRARLVRVGDELHVLRRGTHLTVPCAGLLEAVPDRTWDDRREEMQLAFVLEPVGRDKDPTTLYVPAHHSAGLSALCRRRAATGLLPGSSQRREAVRQSWRSPARTAVMLAGLLLSVTYALLMALGTRLQSPIVEVREVDGIEDCLVEWTLRGVPGRAWLTCPDPPARVGRVDDYVVLPGPLDKAAMSWDLMWVAMGLGLLVTLVATLAPMLVWWRRWRRTVAPFRPVAPAATRPTQAAVDPGMPLPQLVALAAQQLSWDRQLAAAKPRATSGQAWSGRWADLRAVVEIEYFLPAMLLVWAWGKATEDQPEGPLWHPLLVLGLLAAVAGMVAIALRYRSRRSVNRRSWSGPVDYMAMPDITGQWFLLLGQAHTLEWLVAGPPPETLAGRCRVRGDLRAGGRIHVRFEASGGLWVPDDVLIPLSDEEQPLREDLLERLSAPTLGAGPDRGTS